METPDFHSLAEKRSWALHRAVAERLSEDADVLTRARNRVEGWCRDLRRHPYALEWRRLLDGPLDELRKALVSGDPEMVTLRQASPFAGALSPAERYRILSRPELCATR